jgi:hypothetical protein
MKIDLFVYVMPTKSWFSSAGTIAKGGGDLLFADPLQHGQEVVLGNREIF